MGCLNRSPRLGKTVVILPCSKKCPLLQLYICKLGSSCVAPRRAAPFALLALRSFAGRLVRSFLATCGRRLRLSALVVLSSPGTPSRVGVSVLWLGCALLLVGFYPWYASRAPRFTVLYLFFCSSLRSSRLR